MAVVGYRRHQLVSIGARADSSIEFTIAPALLL
jgi:hypothetical protein